MLLRDEHCVKVPESALDETVRRHLGETVVRCALSRGFLSSLSSSKEQPNQAHSPHVEEDLSELFSDFEKGVESSSFGGLASSGEVVLLELGSFPITPGC